ncbi:MAG: NAD-dependent epimerase/dehydratase family protein [Prolixibacteraceae bacterium]|nr:NAD-dependent epimerase/dehydratase family protein [Prolixibacteraceae bacterium]
MDTDNKNIDLVLVTGATGMLGSRVVYDLVNSGFPVRAIYRDKKRISQFEKNIGYYTNEPQTITSAVEWVQADVTEYASLPDVLKGVTTVYHCAAMVSFYKPDRPLMYEVNIYGTEKLVNACIDEGVQRLCHVSSVAALGRTEDGKMVDEETNWLPDKKHTGYSIAKYHSEMEAWRGMHEGLEVVVVNPSIILGPGEWTSGSPAFFNQINKGLKFYTSGITGFVDVRDVSRAMLLLTNENFSKAKGKRYLLNASNHSYKEMFEMIARALQVKPPSVKVGKPLLGIAWRVALVVAKLSGKKPLMTKENVQNASNETHFDGSRIEKEFAFQYRDISETVKDVAGMYRSKL